MSDSLLANNQHDAQGLAEAYTTLINKLPGFEGSINEIFDLNDGHIFSQLLRNLDRVFFKNIDKVADDNWVPKISNLKKVHTFMDLFFNNKKQEDAFKLPTPDFLSIARKQDLKDDACPTLKVEEVTNTLSPKHKDLIANACNQLTPQQSQNTSSNQLPNTSSSPDVNSISAMRQMNSLKEEHEREIAKLQRDNEQIFEELKLARATMEESQMERKVLSMKLKKQEESSIIAGDFNKTEMLFKQEIDELRDSLSLAEQKRQEAEYVISKQNADISSQDQQIQALREKCNQYDALDSKFRELKQVNDRLQRSENTANKYKQRLEDLTDVAKRLKASEDQNFKLVQANSKLEEEVQRFNGFKKLVDSYKEQVLGLESKINTLTIERERKQIEVRGLKETISILEIERDRYQEESMNNESKLRDLELAQTVTSETSFLSGAMSLDEAQTAELKAKIIKLEQELSAIRNGTRESGPTQRIIILESMLEDAKKARAKVEEELIAAHRKNIMLDEELKRFQSTDPGDKLSYDLSLNLRVRLAETEEELSQIKRKSAETDVALESCRNELLVAKSDLSMVGKDQLDAISLAKEESAKVAQKLTQENEETLKRCQELEDESRKQMQHVNQLLMDKDALRTQSLQQKDMLLENEKTIGELKATLVTLQNRGSLTTSSEELTEAKTLLAKETNKCMELREENIRLKGLEENLQLKIKFLNEQIKAIEKVIQDRNQGQGQDSFGEAVSSLKSELLYKNEEVEKLKEKLDDQFKRHRREAAFMCSAWHELGLRAQRESSLSSSQISRNNPSSWLATQRTNLNVQLRRR